jgi:hypothetical protein
MVYRTLVVHVEIGEDDELKINLAAEILASRLLTQNLPGNVRPGVVKVDIFDAGKTSLVVPSTGVRFANNMVRYLGSEFVGRI